MAEEQEIKNNFEGSMAGEDNVIRLYRRPALSDIKRELLLRKVREIAPQVENIETEFCFYVGTESHLTSGELGILQWLLSETFEPENFSRESCLDGEVLEVGPRLNFATAYSTNAVAICRNCGLSKTKRIERSRRYRFQTKEPLKEEQKQYILDLIRDRMTECVYSEPIRTFKVGLDPSPTPSPNFGEGWWGVESAAVWKVPVIEEGIEVLKKVNKEFGLGMDEWDISHYYDLFTKTLKRNPTIVEIVQLGNANSEHSRHHFFKGKLIIDNREVPETLFDIVKQPLAVNLNNSVIAFSDNASAIKGSKIQTIVPDLTGKFRGISPIYHPILSCETHNFPTGIAPFPGAETGTGGRIRDNEAIGRGGLIISGGAGYCVGNLKIPGYALPWEDDSFGYPSNLASPLKIEIEASNGASDYGNKFGEPVILGFTRAFGLRLPNRERLEYIKPIMFTGGIGQIDDRHIKKAEPQKGMKVIQIGGPAYRIGMSGGAASSMIQGENIAELDYNAVQRGDAEMENKMNRVIQSCIELGDDNPVLSIHDQGAGGPSNVLTELVDPAGARINIRKINIGDKTLSVLEIWCAEYQERNGLLIDESRKEEFQRICQREKVPCEILGEITGDGKITVLDERNGATPVNLNLKDILGEIPQKTFKLKSAKRQPVILSLPDGLTIKAALKRVLRLLSVGSKRFLTKKVDRSVTGLIARQQCVGPCQTTLCDVGVAANSHFVLTGIAASIGEQPIKGLINPSAMARLTVAEALTNMVWARISKIEDIKCSSNWMWAAKLPGEGVRIYEAAEAMRDIMVKLGIAIDGGKDSLSMAAQVPNPDGSAETVKSPGTLVVSAYAPCPDICQVVTPDIKESGKSKLMFIDLAQGEQRLGGSALAQVFKQIGEESPDVENPEIIKQSFNAIQEFIKRNLILSGHDRSDGGLITCLLEMAFAGNCGFELNLSEEKTNPIQFFFNEEPGIVVEYSRENEEEIKKILKLYGLENFSKIIGETAIEPHIKVSFNKQVVLDEDMRRLRDVWEETSSKIDELQATIETARQERKNIFSRSGMKFELTFVPHVTPKERLQRKDKPKVAILREEGTNSDREMASAFWLAGFEPWDVAMADIMEKRITLRDFRGVAFCGGFSFADVLGAGKGWAGVIKFNPRLCREFEEFYKRQDTFSLGVCNGCQIMALLGWIPWQGIETEKQPRFVKNKSEIFESRFISAKILPSPSIFLKGMEGSVLGIWVAHGEGRFYCPDKEIFQEIFRQDLAPLRFIGDDSNITEEYPFNPNGSPMGITALSSSDGRHLALMPHPERTFLPWQWPWMPKEFKKLEVSPWLQLFQNARTWCE